MVLPELMYCALGTLILRFAEYNRYVSSKMLTEVLWAWQAWLSDKSANSAGPANSVLEPSPHDSLAFNFRFPSWERRRTAFHSSISLLKIADSQPPVSSEILVLSWMKIPRITVTSGTASNCYTDRNASNVSI